MSSFRKRIPATQAKLPPATKINPHSAQLLVSTGVPSLDDVLGGGLPVGGILLIEQDRQTGYSSTLLSYFASQAIAAGHRLCIVNADHEVNLKAQLPGWASAVRGSKTESSEAKEDKLPEEKPRADGEAMKIAWRYQNLPKVNDEGEGNKAASPANASSASTPFCEKFDLSIRIPQELLDKAQAEVLDGDTIARMSLGSAYGGDMYRCVLDKIKALIDDGFSSLKPLAPGTDRNILRIELRSLGSEFWRGSSTTSILQFLHELRGLLRYSYAACVVSFPAYLYEEAGIRQPIVRRVEHLCDAVIELESFEGAHATPADIVSRQIKAGSAGSATQDYHGFLHIHKLPRLNSLTASMGRLSLLHTGGGSANNLAFRLRRKKFSIETYHLPIEGGVTERRVPASDDAKSRPKPSISAAGGGVGCGSRPGHKDPLEF